MGWEGECRGHIVGQTVSIPQSYQSAKLESRALHGLFGLYTRNLADFCTLYNTGRGRVPSTNGGRPDRGGVPPFMGLTEGGASAMGPNEAVQGRSLKSYEDLDAAGDKGTGELDY